MEIRRLELQDCKSYEHETIAFAPGTNAICGPNGAGKSTILESIGFALFDVPPCRPIGNFVREGARTATITVTLGAEDEREYQVVRRCGAYGQYYVYDPELGQKLVDGAGDVLSWLKEQFDVEESVDLGALFRDAVGVPQGLLTAAFQLTPKNRQSIFDPLLRVEEYAEAFAKLLETRHALTEKVQALETQIAAYRAEVKELPRLQGEAEDLTGKIAQAEEALAQLAPELASLEEHKAALEAERERLRALRESAARLDERISALRRQTAEAARAVEQAELAAQTLAESEAGHQAYLQAQARREALEAEERERARLERAAADCRARQQVSADRVARLQRDLEEALAAAAEAGRLRPDAEAQERLQQELTLAQGQVQRWRAATARLEQERRQLHHLEARLQQLTTDLEERARLEEESQEAERRREALEEALRGARAEEVRESALLEQLEAQEKALAGVTGAHCPVCESDLSPQREAELQEGNRRQQAAHKELLAEAHRQATELAIEQKQAVQEQRALRKALSQLPRAAERRTAEADHAKQRAVVEEGEQELEQLAEANARAQSLAGELESLADPQTAYRQAVAAAGKRPAVEKGLAGERAGADKLAQQAQELAGKLAAYADLDANLAAVRAETRANEPAHQRYLQHQREAGELSARQARRQELQAAFEAAEEERRGLEAELQTVLVAYRPEEYDRVAAAYLQASEARSRHEAQLQMFRAQLSEAEAWIARLQEVAESLAAATRSLEEWRELAALLEYLRRILREAGPQVTRALVEIVSQEAARLYADITNDQKGTLQWTEDYEIQVDHAGHVRTFQQLSGGEQMAAALAVRLALLREVSAINLVFFDEPTSNLDDLRRDNLADQILAIKDFDQLFVVSHDDTFERATDHTIRLAKEDGKSRVVS